MADKDDDQSQQDASVTPPTNAGSNSYKPGMSQGTQKELNNVIAEYRQVLEQELAARQDELLNKVQKSDEKYDKRIERQLEKTQALDAKLERCKEKARQKLEAAKEKYEKKYSDQPELMQLKLQHKAEQVDRKFSQQEEIVNHGREIFKTRAAVLAARKDEAGKNIVRGKKTNRSIEKFEENNQHKDAKVNWQHKKNLSAVNRFGERIKEYWAQKKEVIASRYKEHQEKKQDIQEAKTAAKQETKAQRRGDFAMAAQIRANQEFSTAEKIAARANQTISKLETKLQSEKTGEFTREFLEQTKMAKQSEFDSAMKIMDNIATGRNSIEVADLKRTHSAPELSYPHQVVDTPRPRNTSAPAALSTPQEALRPTVTNTEPHQQAAKTQQQPPADHKEAPKESVNKQHDSQLHSSSAQQPAVEARTTGHVRDMVNVINRRHSVAESADPQLADQIKQLAASMNSQSMKREASQQTQPTQSQSAHRR